MLTYHPAFDIHHCAFRVLFLLTVFRKENVEIDRIRIWDFYLVFPHEARNIRFPQDLWTLKQGIENNENPYEKLLDPQLIFERMKPFQLAALKYLAAYGFIESDQLENKIVKRTDKPIPTQLLKSIEQLGNQQSQMLKLFSSPLNDLKLYGVNGLKDRSKLMDFKYDPS